MACVSRAAPTTPERGHARQRGGRHRGGERGHRVGVPPRNRSIRANRRRPGAQGQQRGAVVNANQRGDVLVVVNGPRLRRRCAPLTKPARAAVLVSSTGGGRSSGSRGGAAASGGRAPVRCRRCRDASKRSRPSRTNVVLSAVTPRSASSTSATPTMAAASSPATPSACAQATCTAAAARTIRRSPRQAPRRRGA